MNLGRRTKPGNYKWSASTVMSVLQNERHCGDVKARKTYTPNYLDHKSKPNRQNRNQYYRRDHHEPIINRDDFITVQRLLTNRRFGHQGLLPYIHVITEGALRGFVEINPRWAGFTKQDYLDAVEGVLPAEQQKPIGYQDKSLHPGDFDLRGYEIARVQYFQSKDDVSLTFSINEIQFARTCVYKLNSPSTIETKPMTSRGKKSLLAYPAQWANGFGTGVYQHEQAREVVAFDRDGKWGVSQPGTPYHTENEPKQSSPETLVERINTILTAIKQEDTNE